MAVEAVMYVVIQKITDFLIQESIIFDKVIDQVEDIRIELRQMRGFLTDAEERHKTEVTEDAAAAKEWVGKYLETLYNVEDIVESYVLKLVRKKTGKGLLQNYGLYFHDWAACRTFRRKMKRIEEKIKGLNESKPDVEDASSRGNAHWRYSQSLDDIRHNTSTYSQTKRMLSSCYKEDDSDFVGFKKDVENLEKKLASNDDRIIRVVGPLGSGKTTLVKRVYNRKSIKEQFVYHVWLNVSEEHVFKDLLLRILNQVNKNTDTELTVLEEEQLQHELQKSLNGKYLIVLDDVRKQPDVWSKLINALPGTNGCKVVLITREEDIGKSLDGDSQPLKLESLSDKESWELFEKSLSQEEGRNLVPVHNAQQNQILEKCKCNPLNIVLLGGFVSSKKMSCEDWTRLCNQDNWGSMDLWLLSYTDLPAHYKLCLLYLTLFPKEFDLSVRRLVRLWLAEGFLQSPPGKGEDLAQECFDVLVKRNLIKVSKFRSDGGPRKCRLPGFLREYLSPKAQEINLFHIHHFSTEQSQQIPPIIEPTQNSAKQSILPNPRVRRIVEYADIKDCASDSNLQNLRSYLSFNFQRYDTPGNGVTGVKKFLQQRYNTPADGVRNFLQRIIGSKGFGLLRVLDLEGVYKPILPTTLKHLFQLRYLGLRWTFVDSLPKYVGDLPYLETLDLKGTYINNLPSSVWKLKRLQHLNLPNVRLDTIMQQPGSQLLTLWGLIIDNGFNIENGLNQFQNIRELGITCQLELNHFDELLKWITGLNHLQSLSLTSKDKMSRPSNESLTMKPLSELHNLSRLKLLGKLNSLLKKDQFPPNLRVLTLSISQLNEDPMEVLSQLQCLSVLRLMRKSYCGTEMKCPKDGFKNLRVLKLWMLDELEELEVEQGGMPNMKELNIRCCQKLRKLPNELLQRNTLEELTLTNMSKELERYVSKNISKNASLQTNSYEFTPLPWEKEPELWDSPQQAEYSRVHHIDSGSSS